MNLQTPAQMFVCAAVGSDLSPECLHVRRSLFVASLLNNIGRLQTMFTEIPAQTATEPIGLLHASHRRLCVQLLFCCSPQ